MKSEQPMQAPKTSHLVVEPSILYFGTPVALIGTLNEDGCPNLAPMSSAWAPGSSVVLGLGATGQTIQNLERVAECLRLAVEVRRDEPECVHRP
jgi:flavin reductase (DIM6/NTAB) family NADH-FMN oxidoreductase RutF